jgi:hypothetical protein
MRVPRRPRDDTEGKSERVPVGRGRHPRLWWRRTTNQFGSFALNSCHTSRSYSWSFRYLFRSSLVPVPVPVWESVPHAECRCPREPQQPTEVGRRAHCAWTPFLLFSLGFAFLCFFPLAALFPSFSCLCCSFSFFLFLFLSFFSRFGFFFGKKDPRRKEHNRFLRFPFWIRGFPPFHFLSFFSFLFPDGHSTPVNSSPLKKSKCQVEVKVEVEV